ncbi:MAG: hypothetical protein KKC26_01680 [Nanoarchaeota archaeon]|nr:hypothetical protein [Nanoarchaeota archaeon]
MLSKLLLGANVGIIVLLPNTTIHRECVNIQDEQTAYDALEKTSIELNWQNFGFGYFLKSVAGFGSTNSQYWSFWHNDSSDNTFLSSQVGASDYDISTDGHVIGLSLTAFDQTFQPITKPPYSPFELICPEIIAVDVDFYINEDKTSKLELKPLDEFIIKLEIKNTDKEIDIDNLEIEITIKEIDAGDDLTGSEELDLNSDDKEELTFEFEIQFDVEEGNYELEIIIFGKDDEEFIHRKTLSYKLEIEKEKHELLINLDLSNTINCNEESELYIDIKNIGKKDEDVTLEIVNENLGINFYEELELEEGEKERIREKILPIEKGVFDILLKVNYDEKTEEITKQIIVECLEENFKTVQSSEQQTLLQTAFATKEIVLTKNVPTNNYSKATMNFWTFSGLIIFNMILVIVVVLLLRKK